MDDLKFREFLKLTEIYDRGTFQKVIKENFESELDQMVGKLIDALRKNPDKEFPLFLTSMRPLNMQEATNYLVDLYSYEIICYLMQLIIKDFNFTDRLLTNNLVEDKELISLNDKS